MTRAAMVEALAHDGHVLDDDDFHNIIGRAWPHTRAYLMDRVGYDEVGIERYRSLLVEAFLARRDEVRVFPDVVATLDGLAAAGVDVAVCTSSGRAHLDRVLAMPELAGRFAVQVCREDSDAHKPDPTPYLLAARRLEEDPTGLVAVEDTPAGVRSARGAGMRVVALERGLDLDVSAADVVVTATSVAAIAAAHRA